MEQQISVKELFEKAEKKSYKKSGTFLWREPKGNETVLTIVSGKLETIKTAHFDNDIVIRNISIGSSAEQYIIDCLKFASRYDVIDKTVFMDGYDWTYAEAKGRVEAFRYSGEAFTFDAPWGEKMICEEGDYIARPLPGKETDIYRIEKETFKQTYTEEV